MDAPERRRRQLALKEQLAVERLSLIHISEPTRRS